MGLPDRDVAVFLAGTAEMDAYLSDLYWVQEYAARNRAVMMALFCEVVARAFAERCHLGWSSSPSRQARANRDPAT